LWRAVRIGLTAPKGSKAVRICFDRVEDGGDLMAGKKPYNYNTLEPKLLKANSLAILKAVLGVDADTEDKLRLHMRSSKTETALAIFNAEEKIIYPDYILEAIAP
jgi:putative ATP-dependent endonuclease of OLD family